MARIRPSPAKAVTATATLNGAAAVNKNPPTPPPERGWPSVPEKNIRGGWGSNYQVCPSTVRVVGILGSGFV